VRRLARPIHDLAHEPIPASSSDPWRDSTGHKPAEAKRVSGWSAPPVGRLRRSHQGSAQFTQLGWVSTLLERNSDVLGRAPHLIDPVGQVGSLVGRQHHRVRGDRHAFRTVERCPLLVSALPTRLPAVLTASPHPAVGDISATPAAWLRADASSHGTDFSRGLRRSPVSLTVGSGTDEPTRSLFSALAE
jgi:hypothetical protein